MEDTRNRGIMQEIGTYGVPRMGGTINDEELADLRGSNRVRTIRQMIHNDPVIGGFLFALKMLIRQIKFRVDPASDSNEDMLARDFVEGALFRDLNPSWQMTASDIVSFLPWGWAWFEQCYKERHGAQPPPVRIEQGAPVAPASSIYDDGLVGLDKFAIRRQETLYEWIFDSAGNVIAMVQQAAPDYQTRTIPRWKSLLFQTESAGGNPEGYPVIRNAFRPWKYKTRLEVIEAIGAERDAAGLPVAWVPDEYMDPEADAAKKAVLAEVKKIVTGIRQDDQGGLVMPLSFDSNGNKRFDLQLMASAGAKQYDINSIINRYNHNILMSVLADFLMLGAEKVGSFALSSDKTDLFAVAIGAWVDSVCTEVNTNAIPPLLRLNGMNAQPPRLAYKDIETRDLGELAAFLREAASAGLLTYDPGLEDWIRDIGEMPPLPEGVATDQ